MSNSTSCSSTTPGPAFFFAHSCSVTAIPGSSLSHFSALSKCCPAPGYINGFGDSPTINCYAYCNTTGVQEAKTAESCIKDYFASRPDSTTEWKCDTADTGAAMRGRTSGWCGLVMLGLVVSAAATML
ncbi:hypothetical protein VE03_07413 [Pseudogymnoascus sp. 23342-1-I1]|nr:hypothetical protein VE03_07413 [Pseudogymnoascus sp. 23342-1-I1]